MRISDREHNRLNVLRILRRRGSIARTELARLSGLTGGTITELSGKLLRNGLLLEEKAAGPRQGRPRVNLSINPEGAYALASSIGIDGRLVSEIVNLRGEAVYRSATLLPETRDLEHLAQMLTDILEVVLQESPCTRETIRCVGIALPAVVDAQSGVVHWLQTVDERPFPVAAVIEAALGISVTIDNNTSVLARAFHWFEGDEADDFTLVNLGYGVSASHYRDGHPLFGAHGFNSEFGHAKIVVEGGRPCPCGARGCLDAYCSITGLVRSACAIRGIPAPGIMELVPLLLRYADAAEGGDPELGALFARAGTYFGYALANLINTFDPGRIIILSEQWHVPMVFRSAVLAATEANCLPPFRGTTSIEFRRYEADLFRQGAAALVLEQVYRSI